MTDTATVISVYDEIGGDWGVPAADVTGALEAASGDVEMRLNSPGGDLFAGLAIYNAMRRHPGSVTVIVDGLAASAASVIAMGASPGRLLAAEGSVMMIHDAWAVCAGNAADMQEAAQLLEKASDSIASVYARRTGLAAAAWRTAMRAETWYTAAEAVAAGLADRVA